MKTLLSAVALCACVAAPAFAQPVSTYNSARSAQWSSRVHMYAPDHYASTRSFEGNINNNLNPDFQLGGGDAR